MTMKNGEEWVRLGEIGRGWSPSDLVEDSQPEGRVAIWKKLERDGFGEMFLSRKNSIEDGREGDWRDLVKTWPV
jgi:hypothetical protein